QLAEPERRALAELHVDRMYVRMFDVAWTDGAATELGVLATPEPAPAGVEVVPVVVVREDVFRHVSGEASRALAARTCRALRRLAGQLHAPIRELQFDCDWTDTTRTGFFAFIEQVRAAAPPGLATSATIRLHQVKYRERTGVPPVGRGMLMFYNMGRFSADPH